MKKLLKYVLMQLFLDPAISRCCLCYMILETDKNVCLFNSVFQRWVSLLIDLLSQASKMTTFVN